MGEDGNGESVGHCEKNTRGRIEIALCQKTTPLFKQPKRDSVIPEYGNSGQEMKQKNAIAVRC